MKKYTYIRLLGLALFLAMAGGLKAQTSPGIMPTLGPSNPWNINELIEPGELAATLNSAKVNKPVIFNIGVVEDIRGAKHIGPVNKKGNLENLKKALTGLPKNTFIVIYCGCCPFSKCPNIRPAFAELKKQGFTNIKLLDLPVNLKTNWRDKGYPMDTAAIH